MTINLTSSQILKGFLKKGGALFVNTTGEGTVKLIKDTGEYEILNFKSINNSNREFSRYHTDVDIEIYVETGSAQITGAGFVTESSAVINQSGSGVIASGDAANFSKILTTMIESKTGVAVDVNSFKSLGITPNNGEGFQEYHTCVAVDEEGNVYASGGDYNNGGVARITKYNSQGGQIWSRTITTVGDNLTGEVCRVSGGYIYLTCNYLGENGPETRSHIAVLKFDASNGDLIWQKELNRDAIEGEGFYIGNLLIGKNSDLFVTYSEYSNLTGLLKVHATRMSVEGDLLWSKASFSNNGSFYTNGAAVDSSGNLYIAMERAETAGTIVVKLDTDGRVTWIKDYLITSSGTGSNPPIGMTIDADDNLIVMTRSFGTNGYKANVVKMTNGGDLIWSKEVGIQYGNPCYATSVTTDKENNIYVLSSHAATLFNMNNLNLTKLNKDGALLWSRLMGSTDGYSVYYYWSFEALFHSGKYIYIPAYSQTAGVNGTVLRVDDGGMTVITSGDFQVMDMTATTTSIDNPASILSGYDYEIENASELIFSNAELTVVSHTFDAIEVMELFDGGGLFELDNKGRLTTKALIVKGPVPTSSVGSAGDRAGTVVVDQSYIYYCTTDYDGTTSIWNRAALSATAW